MICRACCAEDPTGVGVFTDFIQTNASFQRFMREDGTYAWDPTVVPKPGADTASGQGDGATDELLLHGVALHPAAQQIAICL